jgi:hypothetical protein
MVQGGLEYKIQDSRPDPFSVQPDY